MKKFRDLLLAWAIVAAASFPARAQDPGNIEGFTVTGTGAVSAKPNAVEIDLEISAASELTADAIVKYRDARKRLRDAFAALKLDDVTVEERGLLVDKKGSMNNDYFGGFQPNARSKSEVQLSRKLVIRCKNIRNMDEEALLQRIARLLDVAQDAGVKVGKEGNIPYYYYGGNQGGGGLVRFVVDDYGALQESAYDKAIADAKTRAKRLARLGDVELAGVVGVRELTAPSAPRSRMVFNPFGPDYEEPVDEHESTLPRLESSKFQEIPVRVALLVRFAVKPKGPEKDMKK